MQTPYNILKKSPSLLINIKRFDDIIGDISVYPTLFKFKFQCIMSPRILEIILYKWKRGHSIYQLQTKLIFWYRIAI